MQTIALIGFLGGLITGISPCILPVLPVVFFSGLNSAPASTRGSSAAARPYLVIAGVVCSFSVVTLAGSALLSALHLPQDAIRWAALATLTLIGLGLIFPPLQHLIERPFSRIPQRQIGLNGLSASGFGLGLTLGALYVPCAGPVLAAIVVAGGTASIGVATLVLTATFAVGTALPLLVFALAGRRVAQRVTAFRRRQRGIQIVGGITMIVLAVALVFNLPAMLQRAVPDYTAAMQKGIGANDIRHKLKLGNTDGTSAGQLADCADGADQLQQCGPAPAIKGITQWLNTPGGAPIDLASLHGKVVLIDFWAYSCINCQRAIPHVEGWYKAYHDDGFEVIGVHTPEYAFEKVTGNVEKGAADIGITYPIALDNSYSTWTNYRNQYWPAEYLIDAGGVVRHVKFGEGDYNVTETLIRQLIATARPGVALPPPVDAPDTTPQSGLTPETYFGVGKLVNYAGTGVYDKGQANFTFPPALPDDTFALQGPWTLDYQGATADSDASSIKLNYHAKNVYIVVGGAGDLTVTRDGKSTTVPVSGPPTSREIVKGNDVARGLLDVRCSKGLQVFSFTYG